MKIDWIQIIAIVMMVSSILVTIQYYYNSENQSCLNEPLVYGAKEMGDRYELQFIGSGYYIGENLIETPRIYFNSTSITSEGQFKSHNRE